MLATKVLSKTMDTTVPTPDKLEVATITRENGKVKYKIYTRKELQELLKEYAEWRKKNVDKDKEGADDAPTDKEETSGDM